MSHPLPRPPSTVINIFISCIPLSLSPPIPFFASHHGFINLLSILNPFLPRPRSTSPTSSFWPIFGVSGNSSNDVNITDHLRLTRNPCATSSVNNDLSAAGSQILSHIFSRLQSHRSNESMIILDKFDPIFFALRLTFMIFCEGLERYSSITCISLFII